VSGPIRLPRPDEATDAVREILGSAPEQWTPVVEGGYSATGRWVVRTVSGRTAFVKAAVGAEMEPWLTNEACIYEQVSAGWLPEFFGYRAGDDDLASVLVIEDLSRARWGVPLEVQDVELLRDALLALADVMAPAGLPALELRHQWRALARDPSVLGATGLADEAWFSRCLPDLIGAEAMIDVTGDRLVHGDLFLQNWCRVDRGAVIVDWAHPWRGNAHFSLAWGEAGVRAAGGPGGVVVPPGCASWAVFIAGQIAWELVDHRALVHPRLAESERREAYASLCWAADELGLPRPRPVPGFLPRGDWRP
jgi:hypothetical protein